MQVEVDTMALLRARTQAPVPQIYAYEVADGEDNPVGVPFVLMEYLPGNIALLEAQRHEMGDRFGSIPVPFRQAFHASLAVAHVRTLLFHHVCLIYTAMIIVKMPHERERETWVCREEG